MRSETRTASVPIIMLTGADCESDKVTGLEAGVDDYLIKPFSPRELLARIKAVMRRCAPQHADMVVEIAACKLDPASRRIVGAGQDIELGALEFRMLRFFMTHPGRVYSRAQLLDEIWGNSVYVEERTVDVHIRRLRQALEPTGHKGLLGDRARGRVTASAATCPSRPAPPAARPVLPLRTTLRLPRDIGVHATEYLAALPGRNWKSNMRNAFSALVIASSFALLVPDNRTQAVARADTAFRSRPIAGRSIARARRSRHAFAGSIEADSSSRGSSRSVSSASSCSTPAPGLNDRCGVGIVRLRNGHWRAAPTTSRHT
jgi:two-component system phosphate regulon response regulator PhoB